MRWLAGGSYHDIACTHSVGDSTFFSEAGALWPTLAAVVAAFPRAANFPLDDGDLLAEMANRFSAIDEDEDMSTAMHGVVGAVDGVVVPINEPTLKDVDDPASYKNFKLGYAVVVLAVVDAGLCFRLFDVNAGATNDAFAWELTALDAAVKGGMLPPEYYLVGDAAFANSCQLLSPYAGRGLPAHRRAFNWLLSKRRQCVERAFGVLKQTFGVLWRTLRVRFDRIPLVLRACAVLHNFRMSCGDSKAPPTYAGDIEREGGQPAAPDNEEPVPARHSGWTGGTDRRGKIAAELKKLGVIAPPASHTG